MIAEDPTQSFERLCGVVVQVVFHSPASGFGVLELLCGDETVTVVGDLAGAAPGEELTLTGSWTEHPSFGRQFRAASCSCRLPDTADNILQYLASGVLPGVGAVLAQRIVDAFGSRTLEVLQTDPALLAKRVKGISAAKARSLGKAFLQVLGLRECVEQLGQLGISAQAAMAAFRHLGPDTCALVRQDPYILCDDPLALPFTQADDAAAALGLDPDSEARRSAGLLHVLRHNLGNGHTCLPQDRLLQVAADFLLAPPQALADTAQKMARQGRLALLETGGRRFVYLPEYYRAERYIAARLQALAALPRAEVPDLDGAIRRLELAGGVTYAPAQRQAIRTAAGAGLMVLTGGPGTGKTTAVNAILALLEDQMLRLALAAPTGRAAKRLSELTGRKASTIHRLLEVDPRGGEGTLRFVHGEADPLRVDAVVVDEMSMVDALLFESLLRALRPDCRLILVGDADQLPSVGAGSVLRGLIDSGAAPVIRLQQVFRQAAQSLIVRNAHRIVAGEMPLPGARGDDCFFLPSDGADGPQLLGDLVSRRLPAAYGFVPMRDIQVLCATRMGPLGTEQLNRRLQQLLNPPQPARAQLESRGALWREGDRVMQTRNNYDIAWHRDDGEQGTGAFNGDIGIILRVERRAGALEVRFDDRVCRYEGEELAQLELAYAITIHKSQGSEFEAVVLPLAEVPARLCYRNLLYTGVTRARKLLVMLGQSSVLGAMVHNDRRILRYSCLCALLQGAAAPPMADAADGTQDAADDVTDTAGTGPAGA